MINIEEYLFTIVREFNIVVKLLRHLESYNNPCSIYYNHIIKINIYIYIYISY